MWLIVSSLSPHNLHLLFCCALSILALICLVLMALFYATIRRDSVSLLKFPFRSQVQVLSCEMFFSRLKRPGLFFFPFLFPSYCHSVVHRVVTIVSDVCNQSPFVLFLCIIIIIIIIISIIILIFKLSGLLNVILVVSFVWLQPLDEKNGKEAIRQSQSNNRLSKRGINICSWFFSSICML